MAHSFELKLDRASEHLKLLQDEATRWCAVSRYEAVQEADPDPLPEFVQPRDSIPASGRRRIRITRIDEVPHSFSLMIGDVCSNMRASLDHLALSLARKFTPGITDKQVASSEFPIFGPRPMDAAAERNKIGCIDPVARDVVKALQPYHRGNAYRLHPLWQLHELNIIDKHRELALCLVLAKPMENLEGLRCGFTNVTPIYLLLEPVALEKEAVVAPFCATRNPGVAPSEMKVQIELGGQIAFGQGGPAEMEAVVPTLQAMVDFVRDSVRTPLSKFL